ncbi:MAG: divergent polysaccharide deacetylase family protein [Pseudomonadota bacterium]
MADGRKAKTPRLKKGFRLSRSGQLHLWSGVSFLLLLGMLTTMVDLFHLPGAQTHYANEERRRAVIDPVTGLVALGTQKEADKHFDVDTPATDEHASDAHAEPAETTAAPTLEHPAEATPPEPEHPAETATAEPAAEPDPALPADTPTLRTEPLAAAITPPATSRESLVSAPAPEITEKVDGLRLPKRGLKDATPAAIYAQPFKRKPEQILLSFVVMDVGIDAQSIGLLFDMPKEVTIAYSPYARNIATYAESFRRTGHELWAMLPVMTDRFPADDPGPMGLITRMPTEELLHRMHAVMDAVAGSVGMILPPGDAATADKTTATAILGELASRGLLVVSTHPTRTIAQMTSDAAIAPILHRADMVLDATPDESQIKSKLAGLLDAAQKQGEYVVVLSARPQTVQALRDWLKETTLPEPIMLAPLSAIYQPRIAPVVVEEEKSGGHGAAKPKAESSHAEQKKPEPKKAEAKKSGHH